MKKTLKAFHLTSALLLISGTTVSVRAQYSPPTAGLVAWWRAEGNANDSADSHNGTLQGGMGFTPGVFGQAFAAGSNKRVYVPDSPAFQLTSLTMAAWANPSGPGYTILFRGDDRSGLDPYHMGMDPNNGRFAFELADGSGGYDILETPNAMALNQWAHYAVTLDNATHDMRIYLNGVLSAEKTTTVTPLLALDPGEVPGIGIGNVQDFYDFPFQGGIDEVVLYNRALSPAEVVTLVPEPSCATLICCGLTALFLSRRLRGE
ncbi:MAG: hypothetical protein QOJ40_2782 [Verrucomicrobiota bacterium]